VRISCCVDGVCEPPDGPSGRGRSAASVEAQVGAFDFRRVGESLQGQGITACEQPDWSVRSKVQDSSPNRRNNLLAQRSRIVVLAPQPCPPLDRELGDVVGSDIDLVGVMDAFVFKSRSALKRHARDYTESHGAIGCVWRGSTLVTMYSYPLPPGMEQAFLAAMKDLGARCNYESTAWRQSHP
jgi:hypothetical protein